MITDTHSRLAYLIGEGENYVRKSCNIIFNTPNCRTIFTFLYFFFVETYRWDEFFLKKFNIKKFSAVLFYLQILYST